MRKSTALIIIGGVIVLATLGGGVPAPVLLGFATYLVPIVLIAILLGHVRRIAESLERIEAVLRSRESL